MLPVIDLREPDLAARIEAACRSTGFFYVSGHGVPLSLQSDLDSAAREFFSLPEAEKREIEMARGGKAWRGWFPVGGELTSGEADLKEGLYFGLEEPAQSLPLHGPNLFPQQVPALRSLVLTYLDELTRVAQAVLRGVALSLGLAGDYFAAGYTANPTVLFRIFHYPPAGDSGWGVGEHTDYGLLTLLLQDDNGGLQVHTPDGWVDAPPLPDTFVCNIGDMLERLTSGWYRSTPHRVRNTSGRDRLSFPFFAELAERTSALFRPGLRRHGAAVARPRGGDVRRAPTLGRAVTARVRGNLRRLPDRESGQGFSGVEAGTGATAGPVRASIQWGSLEQPIQGGESFERLPARPVIWPCPTCSASAAGQCPPRPW